LESGPSLGNDPFTRKRGFWKSGAKIIRVKEKKAGETPESLKNI